ncbi:hypothetical protein FC15_GL000491 [Lapidilactobacillus concavus DSM 17758]|uniref:Uncharacterized protein n=1 Tax=Lapidilactobacillus concavus DSM 17758 TaxID=1423735 RepID=A0A0R1W8K2_9LACO|nr:hypothetical protein FC15_GL000491 [Lapidilactobacillus concavus DSM 17758]GEL13170.1 hypothetical protein LCO01nite_07190 [Lapidilactobacillus concavus]
MDQVTVCNYGRQSTRRDCAGYYVCEQRAEAKQSVDISQYLDQKTKKQFYPQLWKTAQYKGGTYGLPFNTDTQVIFYNKKLFSDAGLKDADLPTTWSELEDVARKLDVKKGKTYSRVGFYPLWNLGADV